MSDPRPFLLQVQDALTAALEEITQANGYLHDLSASVFRGRDVFGDNDPLPMVAILEPPVPPDLLEFSDDGMTYGDWDILLQGFVDNDPLNPKNPTDPAHMLLADVKKRLRAEKRRDQGDNAFGMQARVLIHRIGRGVVRPADEVSAKAYFYLPIVLRIAEADDPFA